MPTSTTDKDQIAVHVVPTFSDKNKDGNENRLQFDRRRSSNMSSSSHSVGSLGSLMDLFTFEPQGQVKYDVEPGETFARPNSVVNRYDPSRLTPPTAAADFDLDEIHDDDDSDTLHGLHEMYGIDESTGERFSIPISANRGSKSRTARNTRKSSENSFHKQLIGLSPIPLIILVSVGLLILAIVATKPSPVAPSPQTSDLNLSGMELLLYNTEITVNEACNQPNANWKQLSTCRDLCQSSMCCFETNSEKSCYQGNERSCLAHSACTALTSFPSRIEKPYRTEKEKLVLSKMIVLACNRDELDKDLGYCQKLCNDMMCCFDEEEQYNCASVKGEDCIVHAACEALVTGY